MGRCPYIDDSASFMDGYHCTRIGGKVKEYDITRCYCNSSASYVHCPYCGGDDRLRSKPEPETPPRKEPERSSSCDSGDDSYGSGGGGNSYSGGSPTPPRGGSSAKGYGGLLIAIAIVFGLMYLVMYCTGLLHSHALFQLQNLGGVDAEEFTLRSLSLSPEHLYDTKKADFDETGFGSMRLREGPNEIWLEYDGVSFLLGSFVGDGKVDYPAENVDLRQLQAQMVRPLLLTLQDGNQVPVVTDQLTVTGPSGQSMTVMATGDGTYVVLLPNDAICPALTFYVEGFEPLTVSADLSDRIAGAVLTLAQMEQTNGR